MADSGVAQNASMDDWGTALAEQAAMGGGNGPARVHDSGGKGAVFEQFASPARIGGAQQDIDLILDIPVQLSVELGRTKLAIKNLLQLAQGSVVELDGMAGEPMDVLVNGCLIAQGEVVVVNDKFGIRLTDIVTPSERLHRLNR
jgi:flagellar motor switch protein FliN/FliY